MHFIFSTFVETLSSISAPLNLIFIVGVSQCYQMVFFCVLCWIKVLVFCHFTISKITSCNRKRRHESASLCCHLVFEIYTELHSRPPTHLLPYIPFKQLETQMPFTASEPPSSFATAAEGQALCSRTLQWLVLKNNSDMSGSPVIWSEEGGADSQSDVNAISWFIHVETFAWGWSCYSKFNIFN